MEKFWVLRFFDSEKWVRNYNKLPRKLKKASKTYLRTNKKTKSFKGVCGKRNERLLIGVRDVNS